MSACVGVHAVCVCLRVFLHLRGCAYVSSSERVCLCLFIWEGVPMSLHFLICSESAGSFRRYKCVYTCKGKRAAKTLPAWAGLFWHLPGLFWHLLGLSTYLYAKTLPAWAGTFWRAGAYRYVERPGKCQKRPGKCQKRPSKCQGAYRYVYHWHRAHAFSCV
jgi:hypothetical protein